MKKGAWSCRHPLPSTALPYRACPSKVLDHDWGTLLSLSLQCSRPAVARTRLHVGCEPREEVQINGSAAALVWLWLRTRLGCAIRLRNGVQCGCSHSSMPSHESGTRLSAAPPFTLLGVSIGMESGYQQINSSANC